VGDTNSALVCTRDRPGSVVRAVESLLSGGGEKLEVIVIDQSDGDDTERALAPLATDRRVRYVHSSVRGKGKALNEGLRLARAPIVVCTDDDCIAPPGWVEAMTRVLEGQPTAAVAFCNVRAVPYDRTAGYVPAYERRSNRLLRSIAATCAGHGLGAGMAFRRDVVLEMGGLDEAIGPGSRFPSGDDWDLAHRALLRGWHVFETAELSILHDGFRSFKEGREHTYRDWYAIGGVCSKPLRGGYWRAAVVPIWVFTIDALWPPIGDLLRLSRPSGLMRIVGFLKGFASGMRTPVDRRTLNFAPAQPQLAPTTAGEAAVATRPSEPSSSARR
jgi:glycosyltransferase involved in cell wall biosynthesis